MIIYDSAFIYIDSATSLRDKICRIDDIIDALLNTALESAASDNLTEYMLDDGQTKIKAVYKGTDAVLRSIKVLETTKQIYVNRLNGRTIRLVDGKSFRH